MVPFSVAPPDQPPTRTSISTLNLTDLLLLTDPQFQVFRAPRAPMSIKRVSTMAAPSTHVTSQRAEQVQTSGSGFSGSLFFQPAPNLDCTVFKFPVELFFEIFSHLCDHRHYIHATSDERHELTWWVEMKTHDVERSTVIRKLTMTCWALRNALLPILWKNTEGCVVESRVSEDGDEEPGKTYGLYAQCVYLLSNPTIAAYVQLV